MFISAHGLFSDVWASWIELGLNLGITICLAPFYGIAGILMGKIISVFFIAMIWKPYFLFSRGLKKSVSVYWRGMLPYYLIFSAFIGITLIIKYAIIESEVTNLLNLIVCGLITYIPLLVVYFFTLFFLSDGMKYFVARKPSFYNKIYHFNSFFDN